LRAACIVATLRADFVHGETDMRICSTIAASLLLTFALGTADAVDTAPDKPDMLAPARAQIAKKNWSAAVDELKKVNQTGSADWNNLMGYSLRKGPAPDYAAAEKFYNEALRLDPMHRGALEYSGELYLMTGDLAKAEERLATLDQVCRLPCEEYTDLKKSVAKYKANGNKYVAAP
jgi:tetratricopeptide (TPR) repeat protein